MGKKILQVINFIRNTISLFFKPDRTAKKIGLISLVDFDVNENRIDTFPQIFELQKNRLNQTPGFISIFLLKGPGPSQYGILSQWESPEALENWKASAKEKGNKYTRAVLTGESKIVKPPYKVTRWNVIVSSD